MRAERLEIIRKPKKERPHPVGEETFNDSQVRPEGLKWVAGGRLELPTLRL